MLAQVPETGVDELIDVSDVTAWDVVWALVALGVGVLLASLVRRVVRKRTEALGVPAGTVNLMAKLSSWTIIVLAFVVALSFLGAEVTPFYIILILLVVILVVSGRTLIENYGAGVILQTESLFDPGDLIAIEGQMGVVVEVSSRVLKLETIDGRRVVLPNSGVLASRIEILTDDPVRRSEVLVGLAYGTDLEFARGVLLEATASADGVVADPEPRVLVARFGESSIDFRVWFWHDSDLPSEYETIDRVIRALDLACKENALTISFPQRTLWWGDQSKQAASKAE